jgi:DNA polymerase III sliding clamp (beta) subunit (PCNA family)
MPQMALRNALDRVLPMASTDPCRASLNTVHINRATAELDRATIDVVATDGMRMVRVAIGQDGPPFSLTLSSDAARKLLGLLDRKSTAQVDCDMATSAIWGRQVNFEFESKHGEVTFQTLVPFATYPNYRDILQVGIEPAMEMSVPTAVKALKRIRLGATKRYTEMTIQANAESLTFKTGVDGGVKTEETIPVRSGDAGKSVVIDSGYFLEALESARTETVWLHIADDVSPVVIKSIDGNYQCITMPIKVG